jgi:multiple sugar transport system permease protein
MRKRFFSEEARAGYVFVSPFVLGFLVFTAGPLVASMYFSFTAYDIINPPVWIGLENYTSLLGDERFYRALYNTFYYALLYVPLCILVGLALAMLLNQRVRGLALFRTAFYLPEITPVVAASVLWLRLLSPNDGLINQTLASIGIQGPAWTVDATWIKPALVMMQLWAVGWVFIVLLAALQQVPKELHEAAQIDGANAWQRFRHITVPMISAVTFFVLIALTIFSMGIFTQAMVMFPPQLFGGQAGPQDSALFYMYYLFQQAFDFFHMGYASALAWVYFAIVLVITVIQMRARKLVYTESGRT